MPTLFLILIIIVSVAIALLILIQNPKGGGLAGSIAGFNSQFMGVKQTTDVLEKGTWIMAVAIALLSLCSAFFIPKNATVVPRESKARPAATAPSANPGNTVPMNPPPATK